MEMMRFVPQHILWAVKRSLTDWRSQTEFGNERNVSIVGLERQGVQIINPFLDEELYVGDSLLLLGLAEHLEAARRVLIGEVVVN